MPVGSLNLSLKYAPAIVPDEAGIQNIRQDTMTELSGLGQLSCISQPDICGVGGTVRAARKIYNEIFDASGDNLVMETEKITKILDVYRKNSKKILKKVMQLAPGPHSYGHYRNGHFIDRY